MSVAPNWEKETEEQKTTPTTICTFCRGETSAKGPNCSQCGTPLPSRNPIITIVRAIKNFAASTVEFVSTIRHAFDWKRRAVEAETELTWLQICAEMDKFEA